jgi:glutathione peroxidase-family protein
LIKSFSPANSGREAFFNKNEMKKLRILILGFVFAFSAPAVNAQGPIPNITDYRLDFTVADIKGDSIKLSSLKGKVLLLDFWASWCGPCRYSNKHLVKMYKKYKDKGFEIFSVSLDDQEGDWKKAAAKDKITWMSGIDPSRWDAMAAIKWQVDAIPASFLINKNGDVVAINLEKDDLEKKIKELLGL